MPQVRWQSCGHREPVEQAAGARAARRHGHDPDPFLGDHRAPGVQHAQEVVADPERGRVGAPDATSRSRTAAMNSGQGVVLPVMMFCCQAETAVRAMSRTRRRRAAAPTQAASHPAHVPGPRQPQLLLGDHHVGPSWLATSSASRGRRRNDRVVAADPLAEQVVRRQTVGPVPAAGVEHPAAARASTRASRAAWMVDVPVLGRPTCRWTSDMPASVERAAAHGHGAEAPVGSGISGGAVSPRSGRSERRAAGGRCSRGRRRRGPAAAS